MSSVSMSTPLGAPAAAVWGTIRDFNAFSKFLPLIATSTMNGSGVGAVRNLTLQDGAEVIRRNHEGGQDVRLLNLPDLAVRGEFGRAVILFHGAVVRGDPVHDRGWCAAQRMVAERPD